ncbi:PREDICTED: uncharacterized protein LOC104816801 [Tarenaya hassleriana]|uniref:uncharacterized protein LOC104816801 n=1 Tax=Tarenaya hassleriana TaxID=28532 RepID=UPI00053C134B|nr:PREDICTED: uncharacterized protein LOC104816801 [Tarenaya hassleriana]
MLSCLRFKAQRMVLVMVQGFRSMCRKRMPFLLKSKTRLSLSSRAYWVLRAPHSGVASLVARSMLLVLLFLSFSWLSFSRSGVIPSDSAARSVDRFESDAVENPDEILPLLFHDLEKEGLLRLGDKTLFLSSGDDELSVSGCSHIVNQDEMFLVSATDLERQSTIPREIFDFAFTYARHISSAEFIDRTLKVGGILAVQFDHQGPPSGFLKPSNYEIVYLRRFQRTILAMRKTGDAEKIQNSLAKRKLLDFTVEEARRRALSKLEDVLLEPPRASSRKSRTYLKRTRYLPDLMADSLDLDNYPRRVFIDVGMSGSRGGGGSVTEWFAKNYPTRNLEFEMYKIETVSEDSSNNEMNLEIDSVPQRMGMSEWMRENVKEEEYVVMKAEAEVVEEMVRSKSIKVVDELFLECKPKGLGSGGRKSQSNNGGRAYWECLALYGKLRDQGIAVHQWWG